jgi:hypothetical protein
MASLEKLHNSLEESNSRIEELKYGYKEAKH